MKSFLFRIKFLVSPFAWGLLITLTFTLMASHYYESRSLHADHLNEFESLLNLAHQKSIDFRLKQRGERKVSDQVAVLTIDERAIESVGRWPWPREVLAQVLDRAVKLGAKVVALDIVFAEASRPASEDLSLAKVFAQDSAHIVQGAFGVLTDAKPSLPHTEICHELIFSLSRESAELEKKEIPLLVVEAHPALPETLKAFYLNHLQQINEIMSEGPAPQNSVEKHDLKAKIFGAQKEFCETWLDPKEDPTYQGLSDNWDAVLENEKGLKEKFPTFAAWVSGFKSESRPNPIPRALSWTLNATDLTKAGDSFRTGFFNALQDADGAIRRSPLVLRTGVAAKTYLPSLALQTYLASQNYKTRLKIAEGKIESLGIIDQKGESVFEIPVDSEGRMAINFAGPEKMFPHVSVADLLTDKEDLNYQVREFDEASKSWIEKTKTAKKADFFKGKIFFLGATAVGIYDLRVTPFEENYPGVEIHANALDNLLRRDFLVSSPQEAGSMLWALIGIGILLSACLSYFGALVGLTLTALSIAAVGLIDASFLLHHGIVLTVILPLSLILILFIFLVSYRYFIEERGKKELRNTFQKYVSPSIVEEILSDPSKIELVGRKERVTIFFSDIRGFTAIAEKLDPQVLTELLNRYLTPMTEIVFENRGTLDKYMGDGIMAFFGAPISYHEHAQAACRCALKSLEKLQELKEEFRGEGLPEFDIGIGVNTGEVIVGNMGSKKVQSYTVMGDAVNLGSRLESLNKLYGTRILVSEFTFAAIKDKFVCREIDLVRVRGKEQAVRIFELIAEGAVDTKTQKMLEFFSLGYKQYQQKNWSDAMTCFNRALEINSHDPVSLIYIKRCQDSQLNAQAPGGSS